jgi:hypothetical protein
MRDGTRRGKDRIMQNDDESRLSERADELADERIDTRIQRREWAGPSVVVPGGESRRRILWPSFESAGLQSFGVF